MAYESIVTRPELRRSRRATATAPAQTLTAQAADACHLIVGRRCVLAGMAVTDRGWRQRRGLARLIDLLLRLLGCPGLVGGRSRSDVTGLRRAAALRGYRWQYHHTRR